MKKEEFDCLHQGIGCSSLGNKTAPPEPHYITIILPDPKMDTCRDKTSICLSFWQNQPPETHLFINKFKHLEYFAHEGKLPMFSFMPISLCRCSTLKTLSEDFCLKSISCVIHHPCSPWVWEENTGWVELLWLWIAEIHPAVVSEWWEKEWSSEENQELLEKLTKWSLTYEIFWLLYAACVL